MVNETKIEKMIEDLAGSMAKGFASQDVKFEKKIEDLARSMAKGFEDQNQRFEKRFVSLEGRFVSLEGRFDGLEDRFSRLEKDNVWIKNTLENHSTVLARLDQERIFTINHVNRLEDEIKKIKKQLKIA